MIADPTRLHQVVWNLLTNAVKSRPAAGEVRVAARRTASHVRSSEGHRRGIEPGSWRTSSNRSGQAENPAHACTAVWLALDRPLPRAGTRRHGQRGKRGEGLGATFTVTLPINAIESQPAESPQARHGTGRPRMFPPGFTAWRS